MFLTTGIFASLELFSRFDSSPGAKFILESMKVSEVMERTGLTRKALYYYEEIGLVSPGRDPENGYRSYTENDVQHLRILGSLRQLGVGIEEIRRVIGENGCVSPVFAGKVLERRLSSIDVRIEELERQRSLINACLGYDVDSLADQLAASARNSEVGERKTADYMVRQLRRVFPGGFGDTMALIFRPFLSEPVDTPIKERAWAQFVRTADGFDPILLPDTIQELSQRIDANVEEGFLLESAPAVVDDGSDWDLASSEAEYALDAAGHLVRCAEAFLEPFFEVLRVLSSRFRDVEKRLLQIGLGLGGRNDD